MERKIICKDFTCAYNENDECQKENINLNFDRKCVSFELEQYLTDEE